MTLHELLDTGYGHNGPGRLRSMLDDGAELEGRDGPLDETPLHVATRRRRLEAVEVLVGRGADIDAKTTGGKTAYAHALRRGFDEVADFLRARGASVELSDADRLAVALSHGRLDEARSVLAANPEAAHTGNPEEDRLLADMAGRMSVEPVRMLVDAGADLAATGLDSGTPLHQSAWFGQPDNAHLLVEAGAPLDVFERTHDSSPLGWAVHGSRYSGGAAERQDAYVAVAGMLLEAGASLRYPGEGDAWSYLQRLRRDASPAVLTLLPDLPT